MPPLYCDFGPVPLPVAADGKPAEGGEERGAFAMPLCPDTEERRDNMTNDMTKGSPIRLILAFSIPLFIGNVFQQFYSMADRGGFYRDFRYLSCVKAFPLKAETSPDCLLL